MKKLLLVLFITLSVLGGKVWFFTHHRLHSHVKAPTTRYHGYALNHVAVMRAKVFTVLISNEGFGGISRGTGVLIDGRHVLTCAHVVGGNDDMLVYFYPGHFYAKAQPVFINYAKDLAVVELEPGVSVSTANGASFATFQEAHYDGEPITIIGNILGSMKWFVAYGIVSGETERDLLTDGLVRGGDSGGPWINEAGEVLALSDWGLSDGKDRELGISGGISARTINEFLVSWKAPSIFDLLFGGKK